MLCILLVLNWYCITEKNPQSLYTSIVSIFRAVCHPALTMSKIETITRAASQIRSLQWLKPLNLNAETASTEYGVVSIVSTEILRYGEMLKPHLSVSGD